MVLIGFITWRLPINTSARQIKNIVEFSAKAENKVKKFSTAACAWAKKLLRLQVWNMFGMDKQTMCRRLLKLPENPEGSFRQE